jgi:hypothetical protein
MRCQPAGFDGEDQKEEEEEEEEREDENSDDAQLSIDIEFLVRNLIRRWRFDLTHPYDRDSGEAAQMLLAITSASHLARQELLREHLAFLAECLQDVSIKDDMALGIAWNLAQDPTLDKAVIQQGLISVVEGLFRSKTSKVDMHNAMLAAVLCFYPPESIPKTDIAQPILEHLSVLMDDADGAEQEDEDTMRETEEIASELVEALGSLSAMFTDQRLRKGTGQSRVWKWAQDLFKQNQ